MKNKFIFNDLDDEVIELPRLKTEKKDSKDKKVKPSNKKVNNKTSKKKLVLKKKFIILFLIIFLSLGFYSGYNIISWMMDAKRLKTQIENLQDTTRVEEVLDTDATKIVNPPEEDEENPYWDYIKMNLINVDFTKLKKINSDTVGWIQVKGTNINYPFVQTSDNSYYLKKDFNKNNNSAGWVFIDYRNNIINFDKNTIIYAHGRVDGTMFGSLKNIMSSNWYNDEDNYIVKLSTEYENTLWQVFSVYKVPAISDYLQTQFSSNDEYNNFLNMLINRSEFKFNVSSNENDKILTLSTCYKENDRVVLHAKLIKMEVRNGNN